MAEDGDSATEDGAGDSAGGALGHARCDRRPRMSNTTRGPLRVGARVGAFVVREQIGVGATSIVYEAEHRTLRHLVAVKVLRSASDMDGELRLRFDREMKLCTSVSSLHLPHVYEVGQLPSGLPYIVMERLNGSTLAEWLAAHRTLPVPVVVEIGIQLSSALASLHERQVVHRDVKPENVVLHRAFADGYVLKLVDFGICKSLVSDGLSLTRQGTVVGTPEYMSPEQVQGIEVDPRTDVYSTGVVLYELLTGRCPFQGRDLDLLGRAILFATPPRPTALRPELSPALEAIVLRAIARERGDRHASALALERDLDRFAESQALRRHPGVWKLLPASGARRAPPPAAAPRRSTLSTLTFPRIPIRRGVAATVLAATLGVLLVVGLSVAYYAYDPFVGAPLVREAHAKPEPRRADLDPDPPGLPAPRDRAPDHAEPPAPPATLPEGLDPEPPARSSPARDRAEVPAPTTAAPPRSPPPPAPPPAPLEARAPEVRPEPIARRASRRSHRARRAVRAETTVVFAPRADLVLEPEPEPEPREEPRDYAPPRAPRDPPGDRGLSVPPSPYGVSGDARETDLPVANPF